MKLDFELVKQIMISIEDGHWSGRIKGNSDHQNKENQNWILKNAKLKEPDYYREVNQLSNENIITKHIKYCIDANLIDGVVIKTGYDDYLLSISNIDITPYGYEFISNIRKNEVWEKLKSLNFENLSLYEIMDFSKKLSVKWVEKKLGM